MDTVFNIFAIPGFGEMALIAAMIFIVVLLLGLLVWSKWHWSIKASATVMAGLFFVLTYFSIIEMQGWPTDAQIPEKFYLVSFYVDPPNKVINKEGFIVIWTLEFKEKIGRKPRAYMVDYSLKLHKKLNKMRKGLQGGKPMIGERETKKKGMNRKPDSTYKDKFRFYKMPPPNPPSKQ